jgi:hypothetical protein
VVFELSDDFSILASNFLPPEQKGMFVVRADGSGLRRLGPASRNACFRFDISDIPATFVFPAFGFNPSGTKVVFTDLGPGPDGEAIQIFTMDVGTPERFQVTHMPPSPPVNIGVGTGITGFLDERTIAFISTSNPNELNPSAAVRYFVVDSDGNNLRVIPLPAALPGSTLVPTLAITGAGRELSTLRLEGEPKNPMPPDATKIVELFIDDGKNLLQLTHFDRVDTASGNGAFLGANGRRVFFTASADPPELHGSNPSETCQFFSVDSLGGDLRQLTSFGDGTHSVNGCNFFPPGCTSVGANWGLANSQDPLTGTLVFYSTCDPFGTNPNGGQLFAMEPDGSGLRQLTSARGMVPAADGGVDVELPGPTAYGPYLP